MKNSKTQNKTNDEDTNNDIKLQNKINEHIKRREKLKGELASMKKFDKIRYFLFFLVILMLLFWRYVDTNHIFDRF